VARRLRLDRRAFLLGTAAGGGLLLGLHLPLETRAEATPGAGPRPGHKTPFAPNAWIRIEPDGDIAFIVARSEMGQGVMTALPMLLAEELDLGLDQIRVRFAPVAPAYANRLLGRQTTGGSTSVRDAWTKLREAGALTRRLLVQAAAARWGVEADACSVHRGEVIHPGGDRRLGYGELAGAAARMPPPVSVSLKAPEAWTLIGTPAPRLDAPDKVTGRARFGIDVRLTDMVVASIERCPVPGGKVQSFDAAAAEAVPGVKRVLAVAAGVAVVAADTHAALAGRRALRVQWDLGPHAETSSVGIRAQFERRFADSGVSVRREGDPDAAWSAAARTLEAVYEVPFQAHACMEPMNCTADVRADGCDIYVPTQAQSRCQHTAMAITGLSAEQVRVHTTFLGGGFGRRGEQDFVRDAVSLSKALGRPVQVIYTREDDIRHDYYRPAGLHRLRGGLDLDGMPVLWKHHIVCPSILARVRPEAVADGIDRTAVEGAVNLPYSIANIAVACSLEHTPVPVGFWRAVGSSQNTWVTECFLDELAAAGGQDPLALRRGLLADAPRHLGVLNLAAERAGWDTPSGAGRHRGIAVAASYGSYVAQVAEVSVSAGQVRVHRVVCAIDCGLVVNPDIVIAQMESCIAFGLTATLKSAITVAQGRVQQGNFDDFPLLRMSEMPEISVHIVPSDAAPGGVGEPGLPPIAPAVCNAVLAATGTPVRSLPIRLEAAPPQPPAPQADRS
jgi:isoquinoline 1-oxidoreductase beta subunit